MNNLKAQIAIEFLLLTTFALFFLMAILVILSRISSDNIDYRVQTSIQDLGLSIKNEIATASEMEIGYNRELNLPLKINDRSYNLSIDEGVGGSSYLLIISGKTEMYFDIPKISGTIAPGNNMISKQETLTITHST